MSKREPRGRKVNGMTYDTVLEEYERKQNLRSRNMKRQPAGVADALDRAYYGYSDMPRVKPERIKGKTK